MNLFFSSFLNPYSMPRIPLCSKQGMVATSQPTATQAGISILNQGGNAIDAAIAMAASLTVVEPTSNGIGGDAFALVWTKGKLFGLNSSGPSPKSISLQAVLDRGFTEMPLHGWESVTVPGIPFAWSTLAERFGNLPLTETLKPAIKWAKEGYAIPPTLANLWQKEYVKFSQSLTSPQYIHWFETFAKNGRAPKTGEIWNSIDHAKTLQSIAETHAKSFYEGELADRIDEFSKLYNGFLRKEDLATYKPEWVEPISINYRGYDIWEIPPNGQGISALMALNILKEFDLSNRGEAEFYHRMIESIKFSMTDGNTYVTDPQNMQVPIDILLSDRYAKIRSSLITSTASDPYHGDPMHGGTVYLATADSKGNMVSYIQSNYMGFGSGLVVPGTGIALQDRGSNFSLDPQHINCLAPSKRTFHTIIPGFISQNNTPIGPFGVMGGFNQPQGHVQVVTNSIDCHLNPQAALDAPRWRWVKDKTVLVEPHFPLHLAQELEKMGHKISISFDYSMFGRGQAIWRDPETGVLIGGTESRTDGVVAVL